jgi:hypothetical protein
MSYQVKEISDSEIDNIAEVLLSEHNRAVYHQHDTVYAQAARALQALKDERVLLYRRIETMASTANAGDIRGGFDGSRERAA